MRIRGDSRGVGIGFDKPGRTAKSSPAEADRGGIAKQSGICKNRVGFRRHLVAENWLRGQSVTMESGFLNRFGSDSYVDAPFGKAFLSERVIGCFHMSGLFVRRSFLPLALMEIRR